MATLQSNPFTLIGRSFRRGFVNVWRERQWGIALGALTGVFVLFQVIIMVLLGAEASQSALQGRTDLRLELLPAAAEQQIQGFNSAVQLLPYVENFAYIPKEKAYEQMKEKDPQLIGFLEEFNLANPFPNTIAVTLKSLTDFDAFDAFLREQRWQGIIDPSFLSKTTEQEKQVRDLIRVTDAGRTLTIVTLGLTIIVLIFVVTELVRRRVLGRSEEVLVEHLSGAHPIGILLPFVTEAVVLLLFAAIASVIVCGLLLVIIPMLTPSIGVSSVLQTALAQLSPTINTRLVPYLLIELAAIPVIGIIGAVLGMMPRRNIRSLGLYN